MARQIFIGLMTEGTTDQQFLKSIVERTFDDIKFECETDVDIFDVEEIKLSTGTSFIEKVLEASSKGYNNFGMMILCVQADADNRSLHDTYNYKINPAILELKCQNEDEYCKLIVALVPIQEMEAWMLADKELFKREINTNKSDFELGIHRMPESIARPKEVIENAIRIAREDIVKRRRQALTISDLYLPLGQNIDIASLEKLPSFQDFKNNIREAFKSLNLLI